jgi:hypothetical protein
LAAVADPGEVALVAQVVVLLLVQVATKACPLEDPGFAANAAPALRASVYQRPTLVPSGWRQRRMVGIYLVILAICTQLWETN